MKRANTIRKRANILLSKLTKLKLFEKKIKESSENYLAPAEFEKTVLEGRIFSKLQKCLKCVRKAPSLLPTLKSGKLKSNEDCGKIELLKDYFTSVFDQKTTPIPTGTRGGLNDIKISENNQVTL